MPIALLLLVGGFLLMSAGKKLQGRAGWVADTRAAIASTLPHLSAAAQNLVLVHAAYESGFGAARAAKEGNNLFNLTAGAYWTGPVISAGDLEYAADGTVKNISQRFRAYPSVEAGLRDYWTFLGFPRYADARARLASGDSIGFLSKLRQGGFFTLPLDRYVTGFQSIERQVQA